MGNMKQHLGNATSITFLHEMRDLWRSPRGTVLRIKALALVAIALSFFFAAFGSCRRWSNRWIIQKGFLAANVLSLSLGTYSIGLMQSSPVKSEMYPIWAVSLLTLLGCIDSITTYNGLDYKSPLSKVIFQLCLYFGYVLLMSISTVSSDIGKIAICMLSIITFIKSFHRSLELVILVSLALLQLMQLIKCWTSNWARVAFACEHATNKKNKGFLFEIQESQINQATRWGWWMKIKAFVVTRSNWFENYYWQDKLGQYSVVEESNRKECKLFSSSSSSSNHSGNKVLSSGCNLYGKYARLLRMLGLQYVAQVLREMWGSKTRDAIELHADVKASIANSLGQMECYRKGTGWSSSLFANAELVNSCEMNRSKLHPDYFSDIFVVLPFHYVSMVAGLVARTAGPLCNSCRIIGHITFTVSF